MFQHIIKARYFSVICMTKTEIQISMQSWATCSTPIKVKETPGRWCWRSRSPSRSNYPPSSMWIWLMLHSSLNPFLFGWWPSTERTSSRRREDCHCGCWLCTTSTGCWWRRRPAAWEESAALRGRVLPVAGTRPLPPTNSRERPRSSTSLVKCL